MDHQDHQVQVVVLVQVGHPDLLVHRVIQAHLDQVDHLDLQDLLVHQVLLVVQDQVAHQAQVVHPAQAAHLEVVVVQDQVDHLVLLVMMVLTQEDGHIHQELHHLILEPVNSILDQVLLYQL